MECVHNYHLTSSWANAASIRPLPAAYSFMLCCLLVSPVLILRSQPLYFSYTLRHPFQPRYGLLSDFGVNVGRLHLPRSPEVACSVKNVFC